MKMVYVVAIVFVQSFMIAQEETTSDWKIMPSISVSKLFSVGNRYDYCDVQPLIYPPISSYSISAHERYSSTGVVFSARFLNRDFEPFALTLSAGASWFHTRDEDSPIPYFGVGGPPIVLGDSTRTPIPDYRGYSGGFYGMEGKRFMSFPVSIGVQVVFPYEKIDKLMFFAGVEGNLHFLSERSFAQRQVETGFSALGGVAIKMFEFGIRYSRLARINYVGVQVGIRFNQFEV